MERSQTQGLNAQRGSEDTVTPVSLPPAIDLYPDFGFLLTLSEMSSFQNISTSEILGSGAVFFCSLLERFPYFSLSHFLPPCDLPPFPLKSSSPFRPGPLHCLIFRLLPGHYPLLWPSALLGLCSVDYHPQPVPCPLCSWTHKFPKFRVSF